MNSLRDLSGRMVVALALGYMSPMIIIWFLAPVIDWIAVSLGAPSGGGYPLFGGVLPYPSPFTWREALGAALVVVPPGVFVLLWMWSRKRDPKQAASERPGT
jgi:hypothetical protein